MSNISHSTEMKITGRVKAPSGFLLLLRCIKYNTTLYLLLVPVLLYFVIFKYIPMLGIVMAFQDYKFSTGMFASEWVGLRHFINLFQSPDFYRIFANTVLLNVYGIVFGFPVPIILALMLNEVRNGAFKKTVQSILYIPFFISWVVLGGIVITMLSPRSGVINTIIPFFGGKPIFFMMDNFWWVVSYVISGIWRGAGWGTIIYLAAIAGIDQELYEASAIDGAGRLRQMFCVTLPGIKSTIAVLLILNIGNIMNVGFEQIYILQNDAVRGVSEVFSTYEYPFGYAVDAVQLHRGAGPV